MKTWRIEKFNDWFKKNNEENENEKYIVNEDGELRVLTLKEFIAYIYHYVNIENDSSVQDYSYYVEKLSTCPYDMARVFNEFREGSGSSIKITLLDKIDLNELLGHDSDLNFDELKGLSYEEIQKLEEEEDEDAWIIWSLKILIEEENK